MALKTFNIAEDVYKTYSKFCKEYGISMSKQVETFMRWQIDDEPKAREDYLKRLDRIRKQRTIHVGGLKDFKKRFGIE